MKQEKILTTSAPLTLSLWDTLPTELAVRKMILAKARGTLSRRADPVTWQRKLRARDKKRMRYATSTT